MRYRKLMPEAELRRNILTTRLKDREMRAICDEAYRRRQTASGFMRKVVIGHLTDNGAYEEKNGEIE